MRKNQKANALTIQKETFRQLGTSDLREAAGGGRLRVPVGYQEDGTPIYDYVDVP